MRSHVYSPDKLRKSQMTNHVIPQKYKADLITMLNYVEELSEIPLSSRTKVID